MNYEQKKVDKVRNSSNIEKTKDASDSSKGAIVHRHTNIRMVQNVLLVWLDNNIDEDNNEDCRHTLSRLRCVVNHINTFTDSDQCIDFLTDINNENVFMIISGELSEHLVPLIHDIIQLDSIYIFRGNKASHEQWAKRWSKIKKISTEISQICEVLGEAALQCEHNAMSISFMPKNDDVSNKNLDQLDCSFMYTQILKEILLTIDFEQEHIKEFTDHCRELFVTNDRELNNIGTLERTYRDKTPIWWYTYECFLYPMLNRALRMMDVDIIIKMGFFVQDLHLHIKQLHMEQSGVYQRTPSFIINRGQSLSKTDFDQLVKAKGGLISFNNFLSTSKNRDISLRFARHTLIHSDFVGILFIMLIDPTIPSTPFALINGISYLEAEDEVLFSMHTIFRIRDMKPMDENNRLWQVDLTLTSDNDKDLQVLTDRMRKETRGSTGWYRLGELLLKIGESDKAQRVCEVLLEQKSGENEKGGIYDQLAHAKCNKGEYEETIKFLEKSLEITKKTRPPNHPSLAASYNNIGVVHHEMGEYPKALLYYEKILEIEQETLPLNHRDLSITYGNMGSMYMSMGEYSKALSFHEKELVIQQKTLPSNHPSLASTYSNIGLVYWYMGEYSKALSHQEKVLEIRHKTLPPNHPDLTSTYTNIGLVYGDMGEYSKALSCHEKVLEIHRKTLSPNYPSLASSYHNIGLTYSHMSAYSKALPFYEKALEI